MHWSKYCLWEAVGVRPIIDGSCHKYHLCRDKVLSGQTRLLSLQKYACRDKHNFVARNTRLSRQNVSFVVTKITQVSSTTNIKISLTTNICRDKSFVATNILLSQQKTCFVVTNTCHDTHTLVETRQLLSRQKWYLWQLPPLITAWPCGSWPPVTRRDSVTARYVSKKVNMVLSVHRNRKVLLETGCTVHRLLHGYNPRFGVRVNWLK